MSLGVIIGISATIFLLAYIMFKLKTDVDAGGQNHFILQLILMFFIVGLLALMGKATLDSSQPCQWLVVNQTVTGDTTTFTNEYVCDEATSNTGLNFYKAIMWTVRILFTYIFLYIAYEVLKYLGWVVPK